MININFKDFRNDFTEAMKPLEEKYGVAINLDRILCSKEGFTSKLFVTNSIADMNERRAFEKNIQYFACYGVKKSDYGREFDIDGKIYYLIGLNPHSPKNKFVIKDVQGKIGVCSARFLNLAKAASQQG